MSRERMPWRIARMMSQKRESKYEVAMTFSYLMNCVGTLAMIGQANIPQEFISATTTLEEAELVPSEIRDVYEKEVKPGDKPFRLLRKVRDLTHQLTSSKPMQVEPLETEVDLEVTAEDL